ncbi:unnamed protein product [Schistosoma mattheei]|uniref:Uncharacterized protein n=1 Tax=Schistosoma mattheei TaxID=31246 RepID=A0A183PPS1_9TREM|nr:unnamed protein product [Schistosoma mattheei]
MGRLSNKRARKIPSPSNNNNSVTYLYPCSATHFESDNVGSEPTPHLMLDDSVSNSIMSYTSRLISIDNIKRELDNIYRQLSDMRPKAGSLSKYDDLKHELKTLAITIK